MTRICSTCKIDQPLTECFSKDKSPKSGKAGFARRCKQCSNKRHKEWRENDSQATSERDKRNYQRNIENRRQSGRNYYHKHKTERLQYDREYDKRNAKIVKLKRKAYYQKTRAVQLVKMTAYRNINRHKMRQLQVEWKKKNLEYTRTYAKINAPKWKKKNPEKYRILMRIASHRRRVRIKEQMGEFTRQDWNLICQKHDNRCAKCKERKPLTIDHVIPLSKGGMHDKSNIQPLCLACNLKKGAKIENN